MKIEKGFKFGDAIKDNVHTQDLGLVNNEKSSSTSEVISTSLFKEIQSKEKNMCVVGTQQILEGYKKYGENENESNVELIETPTDKESINKGCESAFKYNLTLMNKIFVKLEMEDGPIFVPFSKSLNFLRHLL